VTRLRAARAGRAYIADVASWKPDVDRFPREIGFFEAATGKTLDSAGKPKDDLDKAGRAAAAAARGKDESSRKARLWQPQ